MTEAAAHVADPKRWNALAVLGVAYLMIVLDISIVNVALPAIQSNLGFTTQDLQWVVSGERLPHLRRLTGARRARGRLYPDPARVSPLS